MHANQTSERLIPRRAEPARAEAGLCDGTRRLGAAHYFIWRARHIAAALAAAFCLAMIVSSAGAAEAKVQPTNGLVDCDCGKVAIFENTTSKDGRYVVGWTIRVVKKGANPVDWSLWVPDDDVSVMRDHYIHNLKEEPDFPYALVNCVVDLRRGKTLNLASDAPFRPALPRGSLNAYWSSDSSEPRIGVVQNQGRFTTKNLWLVKIDESGMSAVDLIKPLDQAVLKLVRAYMPLNADEHAISFPKSDWDDEKFEPVFKTSSVEIPFTANLPKSSFDQVTGVVSVRVPDGTILNIASEPYRDDPFHDDPRLAKVDRELNSLYSALKKRLDSKGRAALIKEQTAWIQKRDADAGVSDYPLTGSEAGPAQVRLRRDESLLKSTLRRIEELKKMGK